MHYTSLPEVKILEKYLSTASILFNLRACNLQLYEITDISRAPTTFKIEFFKILLKAGSC